MITFTEKYESGSEFSDEDILEEELAVIYRLLYAKWKEACMVGVKQKKSISTLI